MRSASVRDELWKTLTKETKKDQRHLAKLQQNSTSLSAQFDAFWDQAEKLKRKWLVGRKLCYSYLHQHRKEFQERVLHKKKLTTELASIKRRQKSFQEKARSTLLGLKIRKQHRWASGNESDGAFCKWEEYHVGLKSMKECITSLYPLIARDSVANNRGLCVWRGDYVWEPPHKIYVAFREILQPGRITVWGKFGKGDKPSQEMNSRKRDPDETYYVEVYLNRVSEQEFELWVREEYHRVPENDFD